MIDGDDDHRGQYGHRDKRAAGDPQPPRRLEPDTIIEQRGSRSGHRGEDATHDRDDRGVMGGRCARRFCDGDEWARQRMDQQRDGGDGKSQRDQNGMRKSAAVALA